MRVAQVMAGAAHGGAELFFQRLCGALHDAGETVLPVIRGDLDRMAALRVAGMAPRSLRFGTLDPFTRPRLRCILNEFAPDVVVSWMNRATAHTPRGNWVHVGRLGGYYDLRHYRRCDHLVGNTHGIVAWLRRQGWATGRTHYVPNFVDDCGLAPPASDLPPGDGPWLLGLGRLHTDKGFDTAIRALPALPGVRLAIAGDGPERAALLRLAQQCGVAPRVTFLGWRDDAARLLRAADVFVCSSRIEPLGNMVIEAWSAGCPVVAGDADGPRELIRSGADGRLVPRESPDALAAAIGTTLSDRAAAAAMAVAGRARFETGFSRAGVTARWQRFLREVAT